MCCDLHMYVIVGKNTCGMWVNIHVGCTCVYECMHVCVAAFFKTRFYVRVHGFMHVHRFMAMLYVFV
jgi:hypothetical protein